VRDDSPIRGAAGRRSPIAPASGAAATVAPVTLLKRIRLRWVVAAYYLIAQVYVWHHFLSLTPGKSPTSAEIILPAVAEIVTALLVAAWVILRYKSFVWVLLATANAVVLLVGQFASWYASYGTAENFHPALTRLDGLGMAVGTFTTAGAPGIVPHSELARRVVTVQLVVDILAAIVLFGLLAGRLINRGLVEGARSLR
jgi:hypothetical protein